MAKNKKDKATSGTIALNKKARREYTVEDKFEAGMALQGWEIKSIREGKANISDCFVIVKDGEAYLVGAQIQPLIAASSHVVCDPNRSRKLLLKRREINRLIGLVERDGYSLVATAMYWKKCWVKLEFYIGKGKQLHDKRNDMKDKDWARQKERAMKKDSR